MFRTKRNSLVKRLWKFRILNHDETGGSPETAEELEVKAVSHSMLKRLKEKPLEILLRSVESKGGETTECVMLPKEDIRLGKRVVSPQIVCCQIWRFPNIRQGTELKRLPCCTSAEDPTFVCCNPYHWSVLLIPEAPTPSISRSGLERVSRNTVSERVYMEDTTTLASTETGLTPTGHQQFFTDGTNGERRTHWCHIAYWEHRQRVGRLFTVLEPSIDVFQELPHGDGMSLGALQGEAGEEAVKRTREKIGFGLTLSREGDGVWAYNRSAYPVFVNSPTLCFPNSRLLYVCKVLPGYSLKIFDFDNSELFEQIRDPQFLEGPFDAKSIRISFAKGWGSCYSRQFITSCPCWIEVLLNKNR